MLQKISQIWKLQQVGSHRQLPALLFLLFHNSLLIRKAFKILQVQYKSQNKLSSKLIRISMISVNKLYLHSGKLKNPLNLYKDHELIECAYECILMLINF